MIVLAIAWPVGLLSNSVHTELDSITYNWLPLSDIIIKS